MSNEKKYILFDLTKIIREIGSVSPNAVDDIQGRCDCGAWVDQDQDRCRDCDMPIIWVNSWAWEKCYGSAKTAIAELSGYCMGCATSQELIAAAGVAGFPTKQGASLWCEWEKLVGPDEPRRTIFYITTTKNESGMNAMWHAIAIVKKKVVEAKAARQKHRKEARPEVQSSAPTIESKWN